MIVFDVNIRGCSLLRSCDGIDRHADGADTGVGPGVEEVTGVVVNAAAIVVDGTDVVLPRPGPKVLPPPEDDDG
jgi:hypothetical protein